VLTVDISIRAGFLCINADRAALEQHFCGNVLKHAMQRGIWVAALALAMWLRKTTK
jgi:hypothetical protein